MTANRSDWEMLQLDLMRIHNFQVKDFFRDVPELSSSATDGARSAYFAIPRNRLRYNSLIDDDDSALIALTKMMFFWLTIRAGDTLLPSIYAAPSALWEEEVKYKPQVQLVFQQDEASVPQGETRLESIISFRLMNETELTMNETKARTLANQIANTLANGSGYTFNKGKVYCYYTDKERGYDLRILVLNESEGREVVNKILQIQDHPFDEKFLRFSDPKRSNTAPRITRRIYNKQLKERRWRPNAVMRFRQAFLLVHGYGRAITLVDGTGRYLDGLAIWRRGTS